MCLSKACNLCKVSYIRQPANQPQYLYTVQRAVWPIKKRTECALGMVCIFVYSRGLMAQRLIEFIPVDPHLAWLAFSRFIIVMVIWVCLVLLIQVQLPLGYYYIASVCSFCIFTFCVTMLFYTIIFA